MDRAGEKSKRFINRMFDKQNQMFLNLTEQMQENMLKMDENIKIMAAHTRIPLKHIDKPALDVRKTSPVARHGETESTSASDAPT